MGKTGTADTDEQPAAETENERVVAWRAQQLLAAGFPEFDAFDLAHNATVDVHVAAKLLADGCDLQVAVDILR